MFKLYYIEPLHSIVHSLFVLAQITCAQLPVPGIHSICILFSGIYQISIPVVSFGLLMQIVSCTVPFNYNFIFTCVSMCGATRKIQCILIMCLYGPCFLMAWNIHISCNLLCATRGIATHRIAMRGVATL